VNKFGNVFDRCCYTHCCCTVKSLGKHIYIALFRKKRHFFLLNQHLFKPSEYIHFFEIVWFNSIFC
jgi:hypothetical protein